MHRHRSGTAVAVIAADVSGFSDEDGAGRRDGAGGRDSAGRQGGTGRQRATEWRAQAAERMLAVIRPSAAATRVGSDEFAFLFHDLRDPVQASEIAGQICDAARCPPASDDMPGPIAVRVGVAVADRPDTSETLITGARVAARVRPYG
jgi:hypothetical protein